jgi:arginyl-tRNA synthetase
MIQKSDGASNYTTTDLATLAYREETWNPDEIIYVTDGRQQLHFTQLFEIYKRWHPEAKAHLTHVWFGKILGADGRAFKTRSGQVIGLSDLLNEAEERALQVVNEKNPDLDDDTKKEISRVIGLGAIKYADLLPNRQSDYQFSWDKMLSLNGNTAPYLLYAYTRIRSNYRKLSGSGESIELRLDTENGENIFREAQELALAKQLLNFAFIVQTVAEECRPNYLCNYLFELAGNFASFYEACPVLKSEGMTRQSRLALCELTGRVLKQGLNLLGIETTEKM